MKKNTLEFLAERAKKHGAELYSGGDSSAVIRFGYSMGGTFGCNIIVEGNGNMYIPEYFIQNATSESLADAVAFLQSYQVQVAWNEGDLLYRAIHGATLHAVPSYILYDGEVGHGWDNAQEYYFGDVLVIVTPDKALLMKYTTLFSSSDDIERAECFVREVRSEY